MELLVVAHLALQIFRVIFCGFRVRTSFTDPWCMQLSRAVTHPRGELKWPIMLRAMLHASGSLRGVALRQVRVLPWACV
jgi:hypothetical protein